MGIFFPVETLATATAKVDVGSWGLRSHYDESEGRVHGLCTESLGSESSCDEGFASEEEEIRRIMFEEEEEIRRIMFEEEEEEDVWKIKYYKKEKKMKQTREFPPPLPSLETRGRSFMKAVRDDGRLLLTEVRYERPEILHATREDGRLRLHLVHMLPKEEETEQDEEEEEYELEMEEEEEEEEEHELEEEERWRWPVREVEGGGNRRCQDMIGHDPIIRRTINITNSMDHVAQLWRINSPRFATMA